MMSARKKILVMITGAICLTMLEAVEVKPFWHVDFQKVNEKATAIKQSDDALFRTIEFVNPTSANIAVDEESGAVIGIKFGSAGAMRLEPVPAKLAQLDQCGEFTVMLEVSLAASEAQVNWSNNLLFTRCRYQENEKSWVLVYEKWGTLSFTVFADGKEIQLKNFAGDYQKIENQKLKVFASFQPGLLSLSIFAADGSLLNRENLATDIKKIDTGNLAKYFAISGAYWSDPNLPGGGFVGTIHQAAIWNQALTSAQEDAIAKSMGTPSLPQDAIRYQEQAFWEINRESADNAGVMTVWNKPTKHRTKLMTVSDFAGNLELNGLYHRGNFELHETFAVTDNPDQKERLGIARSTWRVYTKVEGYYSDQVEGRLREALASGPEVIMIGKTDWMLLPADIQKAIKDAVAEGAGLIFCYKSARDNEILRELLSVTKPITADFAILPYSEIAGMRGVSSVPQTPQELPGLRFGQYGKGRVVYLAWDNDTDTNATGVARQAHCFTYPERLDTLYNNGWSYEFSQALLLKLINLASGKVTNPELKAINLTPEAPAAAEDISVNLATASDSLAQSAKIIVRYMDNSIRNVYQISKAEFSNFKLPGLGAGKYAMDVILYDENNDVIDFGAKVFDVSGNTQIVLKLDYPQFPDNTVSGTFDVRNADNLLLRAFDNYGRELYHNSLNTTSGSWSFDAALRVTNGITVELSAFDRNDCLLARERKLAVFHDRSDFENEFTVSVWSPPAADYLGSRLLVDLFSYPEVGVYLPDYKAYEDDYLCQASEWPFHYGAANISPYLYSESYYAKTDLRDLVRTPCLSDPAYKAQRKAEILRLGNIAKKFNPAFYSLGDEPYLVGFWDGVNGRDVCTSEYCTADLHRYLERKYGTIDKLNTVWKTNFNSFSEAQPVIFEDAVKQGNLAPWVDHRQHMVDVFLGALEEAKSIINNEVEPGAPVGPEGLFPADPFKGYDWYRMGQHFDFIGGYGFAMDPTANHLLNSFRFSKSASRRISISGWYPDCNPRGEVYSRFDPWGAFLSGQDGLLMWMTMPMFVYVSSSNGINPQGKLTQYWREVFEEIYTIRNRYYKLLKDMERPKQKRIAIYYSRASEIVGHLYTPKAMKEKQEEIGLFSARQWDTLLSSSGVERYFIADQQVIDGLLRSDARPAIVILPAIVALSDDEINELKEFVKRGGTLIADILPGVYDENGTLRSDNNLDEIFGVASPETPTVDDNKVTLNLPESFDSNGNARITLTSLANQAALPDVKSLGKNRFVSHQYGEGKSYLINAALPDYRKLARAGKNSPAKSFMKYYLRNSGIFDDNWGLEANGDVKNIELVTFEDASSKAEYIGVLKNARYAEVTAEPFTLELGTNYHIYNSRTGKYLGFADKIEASVSGATTQLFALLPYEVKDINIVLPKSPRAGDTLTTEITIVTKAGSRAGHHSTDIQIFDADGKELSYLRQGLDMPEGRGIFNFPLALNMNGDFTLQATDSATGIVGKMSFHIEPSTK